MKIDRNILLNRIDSFANRKIVVVGDLILDHYIWGNVNRISPEAPVVVVDTTEESKRPGGAGNVVNNLVELGAEVAVCGVVGADDNGKILVETLQGLGVNTSGIVIDEARPTSVKTRVIAHAQQVVRVDRELRSPLSEGVRKRLIAPFQEQLNNAEGVIFSDYAKGVVCKEQFDIINTSFDSGLMNAEKCPVLVDPKAPNFPMYSRASIIKPNRKEAEEASGLKISTRDDAIVAGRKLLSSWNCEFVLITLGEDGMVVVGNKSGKETIVEVDTVAREVFDVSGAGDTVSAVFLLSLSAGATLLEAAQLANYAAGIVVAEVGTVAVKSSELRSAIQALPKGNI